MAEPGSVSGAAARAVAGSFVERSLLPVRWWRRLLKLPVKGNAPIALENLLAQGKANPSTISEALLPYRLTGGEVRGLLKGAYSKALTHCLTDDSLDDVETQYLVALRKDLGLSDAEVCEVEAAVVHPRYEKVLREVLADSHITERERESLTKLQAQLRLPDDVRDRVYAGAAGPLVQKAYDVALSDRRLSPDEEAELKALADNLGIGASFDTKSRDVIEQCRLLWRIENGDIPAIPVEIHLQKGEQCHFQTPADWKELRTVTRRISYAGPTVSIPIVKGVRFRMGSFAPAVQRSDVLTDIDSGTLYITNKRLLFDGGTKNTSIRLNKILSFQVYSDAIAVEKDTGRSPYLFIHGDIELAAVVLSAVLERA